MPDLNKQTLVNLLIDSPLRDPIKINLIDIVNNTKNEDLNKVHSTIRKEIEIYTKATKRRLKLADEITAKISGKTSAPPNEKPQKIESPTESPKPETKKSEVTKPDSQEKPPVKGPKLPPLLEDSGPISQSNGSDKPAKLSLEKQLEDKLPKPAEEPPVEPSPAAVMKSEPVTDEAKDEKPENESPEPTVPATPPTPISSTTSPGSPPLQSKPIITPDPIVAQPKESNESEDEQALKEIQQELNTLKNSAASDANGTAPVPPTTPEVPTPQPPETPTEPTLADTQQPQQ